jgi:hypothetical protein
MSPAPHCRVSLRQCPTAPLRSRADSCALAQELMDITSNERAAFLASSGEGSTERAWLGPWRAIEAPSLRVLEQARRFKGRMLESDKVPVSLVHTLKDSEPIPPTR